MSTKYQGRHRSQGRLSDADTQEIQRILGIKDAPLRTIEQIAAGPSWVRPLATHGTYNPVPPPPRIKSFTGPPVWRVGDWMTWIMSWRPDDTQQEDSYRMV